MLQIARQNRKSASLPTAPARNSVLVAGMMVLVVATAVSAQGPSSGNPDAVLAAWADGADTPQAAEQYALAVQLYAGVAKEVARYEEAIAENGVKRLKPLPVGKTHAANEHLLRVAERLREWGEPAGYDLVFRARELEGRLNAIRIAMSAPYEAAIQKALPAFQARAKKQQKVLDDVNKLFAKGKLAEAEEKLLSVYLDLQAMAWWYDGKVVYGDLLPYGNVDSKVLNAIVQANTKLAAETIVALRDKAAPDFKRLPSALEAAATALTSAPKAEFNGKSLTGPGIFIETIKGWRQLNDDSVRAIALNLAISPQHDAGTKASQLIADTAAMRAQLIAGLVKLIDADTSRATASEAAELHAEYLDLAAKLTWVSRDQEFLKALDAALDRLAIRSPGLKANVAAYRGATDDLLRWRNRAAEAIASTYRQKSSKLAVTTVGEIQAQPTLPTYITGLAEELVNKNVFVAGEFLGAGKSSLVSGLTDNTFVRVATPKTGIVTTLETDLLVTAAFPPLTLSAAKAIRAAEHGSFVECGGTVSSIELLGAIPFLATETPQRRSVLSLGEVVPAKISGSAKPPMQLILVTELVPQWIRGDGYFAVVAP